ncbi:EF-hand domain [Dillenia turbinata]|uniref:EF-hand domain n=1 Tax=Dillenia turbinata TaxID=194707 RepID=A0AAN8WHM1_9MAGN
MLFIGKLKTTSFNMAGKPSALALTIVFFAVFVSAVHGRLYRGADLVSDGVSNLRQPSFLTLNPFSSFSSSSDSCDQTYGVLPCTTTIIGNLFLIVVYGYLMFTGAKFLSGGSELLLEILGPGIVGGLFLPILGALPDALLILVSGLSGSTDEAQSQVSVGMGLLAGSTVMLLTLIWGSCVCVGKCDLQDSLAVDLQDTKGFNLLASGVSTDIWTSYAARIMAVSVIPFIIVQVPLVLSSSSGERLAILISLIVAVVLLITYCLYQVFQPWIQKRRLAYVKHKHVISGILRHLKMRSLGRLMTNDGRPNEEVIRKLFATIDEDKDNYLSAAELKALIVGIQFDEIDFDKDDAVKKVMQDFDTSLDSKLDSEEFVKGISKWLEEAKRSGDASRTVDHNTMKYLSDFDQQTKRERDRLGEDVGDQSDEVVGDQSDEVVEAVEDPKRITIKAVLMLLVGTVIAGVFADPLVDAVDDFSDATSIPAFFISFIALPLATNSSEAVSAIIFASRKNKRSASLTFSELYGAVTMNNVLCLAVFLALVYIRGLTWDFSSEVLIILIVCIVMGGFASFRITFPLWTSLLAFVLYPLSLALVYILDEFCGWS